MIWTATAKGRGENPAPDHSKTAMSDIALVALFPHSTTDPFPPRPSPHTGAEVEITTSLLSSPSKPPAYHQTSWSWLLPGHILRCCRAKQRSSYQTSDLHPHFKGEETSSEEHSAYLEHIISWERPQTSMQRTLFLGCNGSSGADAPTWRLVCKGASSPHSISCISMSPAFPHPISLEAGNPRDMGTGRKRGSNAKALSGSWPDFNYHRYSAASPEGSELAVLGDSM